MALSPNGSTRLTMLPTSYLANLPPDTEVTLNSLVQEQERLADEAREAMPYAFDECSYEKGYVRQSVWSCIDCGEIGVCYGCSISCHSEHKLVELWTRRHFRCDCPTDGPSASTTHIEKGAKRVKCTLNPQSLEAQPVNNENKYNQNYRGDFCRCGRPYDPETEKEGMLCCIGCEDWYHESCLNLRQAFQVPATDSDTIHANGVSGAAIDGKGEDAEEDDEYDEDGAIIRSDTYDGLVCAKCVASSTLLSERAGTKGYMTVVTTEDGTLQVLGREDAGDVKAQASEEAAELPCAEEGTGPASLGKRQAEEALPVEPSAKRYKAEESASNLTGKGDVFLCEGVRDALRAELSPEEQAKLPFPLIDEEIYEPPKDSEPEETLEEVTERVVGNLPRVNAIEALHGYARIRDGLRAMLQSHAQEGRVVSRADIQGMFEVLRAEQA